MENPLAQSNDHGERDKRRPGDVLTMNHSPAFLGVDRTNANAVLDLREVLEDNGTKLKD